MDNFEVVVNSFSYLLEERSVSEGYIEKLFKDVAVPLLNEDILCNMRIDDTTGTILMYLTDKGTNETRVLIREG
jgi:hypothetical protein